MELLREVELLRIELHHVSTKLQVVSDVPLLLEFQELYGESTMVLSMELGSLESLAMAMMPSPSPLDSCHPPDVVDYCGLVGSCTLSSIAIGHVASSGGKVDETGVLSPNSKAFPCEKVKMSESIVLVVHVVDDVEVAGMLAYDALESRQPLTFVEPRGSDVAVTHSHKTIGQVSLRAKVDGILFQIHIHRLLKRLEAASLDLGRQLWGRLAFADLVVHVLFG
ncbi:hypothetical protein D1007_03833 [Hordeum vulgare]|nr:hypothetical protein D1007_03833 [Hordeum vulgare]